MKIPCVLFSSCRCRSVKYCMTPLARRDWSNFLANHVAGIAPRYPRSGPARTPAHFSHNHNTRSTNFEHTAIAMMRHAYTVGRAAQRLLSTGVGVGGMKKMTVLELQHKMRKGEGRKRRKRGKVCKIMTHCNWV